MSNSDGSTVGLVERAKLWDELKDRRIHLEILQRKFACAAADRTQVSAIRAADFTTASHCLAVLLGELAHSGTLRN